ncbi:MAG: hypothetical protein HYT87_08170 [Nitrospirae bacterium]|nr:hypothetical protein [Nitrospirota bacterium]
MSRLIGSQDPLGNIEFFEYDKNGNLVRRVNRNRSRGP